MHSFPSVKRSLSLWFLPLLFLIFSVSSAFAAKAPEEVGLLFYLSGDNGFTADFAKGNPEPTMLNDVAIVKDGANGSAFSNPNFTQLFAYESPGNMYAERGTFSFFWRPRDPVGKTPFHIVQGGFTNGSDIQCNWMRIDYNGEGGIDAFVTDANLARVRAHYTSQTLFDAKKWYHIAMTWDETKGVRLYLDGKLVAKKDTTCVLFAGIDQWGTGARGVGPNYVGSEGNFMRGGDYDEYRIYDRMLPDDQIARLAKGQPTVGLQTVTRTLDDPAVRAEWWHRYGWNRPGDVPAPLSAREATVRRVEVKEAFDYKQWWWKGNDGVRETVWPSLFNRSSLPGHNDYMIQPDWNCYSISGKSITFTMNDEPWNHIEISGAAYGKAMAQQYDLETKKDKESFLFSRPKDQERTANRLPETHQGGKIAFTNDVREMAIGDFMVYNVTPARELRGITTLSYRLNGKAEPNNATLTSLVDYINGRFLPDERCTMVALPGGARVTPLKAPRGTMLPLVHILIPYEFRGKENPVTFLGWYKGASWLASYTWENMRGGLDGIAIDLPALRVKPTHGEYFPLNIRIKDPIWPDRDLFDFTFSVKPGEAKTLFMDIRDKVLPNGYPLYLTIAGAGQDFGPDVMEGTQLRLVFKEYNEAVKEQEIDRFTQLRDTISNLCESGANSRKLRIFEKFDREITDLFRVSPNHELARVYWNYKNGEQRLPEFKQPEPPAGVPLWAFRQIEDLKLVRHFVNWWIDNRQIENGEFGGGLSDDGDMTHQFIGLAHMGVDTDKITRSIRKLMEAHYDQGMFTNGMITIQTDELHVYEDGLQVLPQDMNLSYGNPKIVERLMETSKAYERITGINPAGHRHFRSNFYGATKMAEEGVWQYQFPLSYCILHSGLVLVEFNGNPEAKKLLLEVADGLLAHRKKDANGNWVIPSCIHFTDDKDQMPSAGAALHLFWAAYRWTGDEKYLLPINDAGPGIMGTLNANVLDLLGKRDTWGKQIAARTDPHSGGDINRHVAWQMSGNKQYLEELYGDQIANSTQRMYLNTDGQWWIDRVTVTSTELQRARLGGVAEWRGAFYPGHVVSWKFKEPANGESVAILIPKAKTDEFTVLVYNLKREPVSAAMTGWDVAPGTWEVTVGRDTNGDDVAETSVDKRTVKFERTGTLDFTFDPGATTVINMKLVSKGTPYWERPDLGISMDDVKVSGSDLAVTVHNIGAVDTPQADIVLRDAGGASIASATVPALKAPVDLQPKTATVTFRISAGKSIEGCRLVIDPDHKLTEITLRNNEILLPGKAR
ncbi:MAG: LamG-like jellyroll fold domain-containing protein [Candidatus Latescibacter sp.]|nr:LamG-like jellyroll fold domain-containing protein [Candidatus Latescibacter sp.]